MKIFINTIDFGNDNAFYTVLVAATSGEVR